MKPSSNRVVNSLRPALLFTFALSASAFGASEATEAERLFTLKVKPLLSEKCFGCHGIDPKTGKEKFKGKLDLRSRAAMLKGGESIDDLLVPGSSAESFIMTAIKWEDEDYEMPPKENDRLSAQQITFLETWIDAGAPWPDQDQQAAIRRAERKRRVTDDGEIIDTSGGLAEDWTYRRYKPEGIWSFKPVVKPALPAGQVKHPIDAFVRSKLRDDGMEAAPQADPITLLRRVTFDLTGLPPTPGETKAFLIAWKQDAEATWNEVIDRLLASPHYGERWAQHWLDVVRYGDTAGYSNDWERSNAWRYRDYVIRSFNKDKPWKRFIVEQLAGDELQPDDPEMKVATGFLRMGPWEHTAMSPDVESRQLYLDDLVNITGQAFMSTTMRCAKCHDHKFDPLPTRDYYRMYAAFATTQPAEMAANYLPVENRSGFKADRAYVEAQWAYSKKQLDKLYAKREAAAKKWYAERNLEYRDWQIRRRGSAKEQKPPRFVGLSTAEEGRVKVREGEVKVFNRSRERFQPLAQSVYNGGDLYQNSQYLRPPNPKNKNLMERANTIPESVIHSGGSIYAKGEKVTPGVLSAIGLRTSQGSDENPFALNRGMHKRRLSLARWIAHKDNSLTTRSIVNRIWHYHFGRGLAANPNNFGATGGRPTHPELLDFLAATFVENGWSLKKLHKLILTSESWKMATAHPDHAKLEEKDPDNKLLWVFRPRRLTAEELRDSILLITGELNREMGGLPTKPEINREVAFSPRMIQFSLAPVYQPSRTPAQRNRRSIYSQRIRGLRDPMMVVLNKPIADTSCEARDAPNVTPQVFTMLNSDTMTARSIALALRLQREARSTRDRIARAFELSFSRRPSHAELETLTTHYDTMVAYHRAHQPEATEYPTSLTRSLVEEFTGEAFEYEEHLHAFQDYTPDPQPADVSPETRALADVAMLIFNTNEYTFVY
jgi:hypothetical protein